MAKKIITEKQWRDKFKRIDAATSHLTLEQKIEEIQLWIAKLDYRYLFPSESVKVAQNRFKLWKQGIQIHPPSWRRKSEFITLSQYYQMTEQIRLVRKYKAEGLLSPNRYIRELTLLVDKYFNQSLNRPEGFDYFYFEKIKQLGNHNT